MLIQTKGINMQTPFGSIFILSAMISFMVVFLYIIVEALF